MWCLCWTGTACWICSWSGLWPQMNWPCWIQHAGLVCMGAACSVCLRLAPCTACYAGLQPALAVHGSQGWSWVCIACGICAGLAPHIGCGDGPDWAHKLALFPGSSAQGLFGMGATCSAHLRLVLSKSRLEIFIKCFCLLLPTFPCQHAECDFWRHWELQLIETGKVGKDQSSERKSYI